MKIFTKFEVNTTFCCRFIAL